MFEDLNECVRRSSSYRGLWLSCIANITYQFAKEDVDRVRARLIAKKHPNTETLAKMEDSSRRNAMLGDF